MWARLATRGPGGDHPVWQTVANMTASPRPALESINRKLVQKLRSAARFTLGCLAQAACPCPATVSTCDMEREGAHAGDEGQEGVKEQNAPL